MRTFYNRGINMKLTDQDGIIVVLEKGNFKLDTSFQLMRLKDKVEKLPLNNKSTNSYRKNINIELLTALIKEKREQEIYFMVFLSLIVGILGLILKG